MRLTDLPLEGVEPLLFQINAMIEVRFESLRVSCRLKTIKVLKSWVNMQGITMKYSERWKMAEMKNHRMA